jgi:hypothetical protein
VAVEALEMTGVANVVRSLLEALRHAGRGREAEQLEQQFEARDWQLGPQDQLEVLQRLQRAAAEPPVAADSPPDAASTDEPQSPRPAPLTGHRTPAVPAAFAAFGPLAPWVTALVGGWDLVEAVHRLLVVSDLADLERGLRDVFVDLLGYEAHPIDETGRLTGQRTVTAVRTVCRHDDFHVVAATSTYAGFHTTAYEPVFRLHPRCVVFALEAGYRLRILSRRVGPGTTQLIGQRVLRGRGRRSFPDDDVFVWSRRLASLEPGHRDDGRMLGLRADDLIRARVDTVATDWCSAPVDAAAIPGPTWEASIEGQIDAFLQPDAQTRLHYGLNAELRSAFPWRSGDGRVEVHLREHRVTAVAGEARVAESEGTTLAAELELELEAIFTDESTPDAPPQRHRFVLPSTVAVPDATGTFVVYGRCYRFVPGLASSGHAASGQPEPEPEPAFEEEVVPDAADSAGGPLSDGRDGDDDDDDVALSVGADADADLDAPAEVYGGAGLVPLLRWVVGRRLRSLAAQFASARSGELSTSSRVRWWIGRACDGRSRLELTARSVLMPYLEPASGEPLPTYLVPPGPLPPTACVELARAAVPGRAYPVSGARIGPGGVLYGPVRRADGQVVLHSGPWPAGTDSPRRSVQRSAEATLLPWIAAPLRAYADLQAGALASPLELAHASHEWTALVFEGSEEQQCIRVAARALPSLRRQHRWTCTVPCLPGAGEPPRALVEVGSFVDVGDPIAAVARPWADGSTVEHELIRVGHDVLAGNEAYQRSVERERARVRSKRDAERGGGATLTAKPQSAPKPALEEDATYADSAVLLRCPPSARGRVEQILIVEVRDLRGFTVRYRLTVDTSVSSGVDRAVLPDGRVVPIIVTDPENLPWQSESGEMADAHLCPIEPSGMLAADADTLWRDGFTGSGLGGRARRQTLRLLPEEATRPPDPCLPYRALDGWGCPRATDDPALSMGELRMLAGTAPEVAERLNTAIRSVHGSAPSALSILELCRATHLRFPLAVPSDWTDDSEQTPETTYDPLRTALHRSGAPYSSRAGSWSWMCDCGTLTGAGRAQLRCADCGSSVKRLWRGRARASIALRLPALHPWRKRIVAAVLGLCLDELTSLSRTHDCAALGELTRDALGDPTRSLTRRIARCDDAKVRRALAAELTVLERAMGSGLKFEELWLSHVEVLSARLLFDGYRTGAPGLVSSPLTQRYRQLEALARVDYGDNEILRRAAWIEQQKAVDALFGDFESAHPPSGTLCELWQRVWPTTAPERVSIAVPGLFAGCTSGTLRSTPSARLLGAVVAADDRRYERGILTREGVVELPGAQRAIGINSEADTLREHDAWARCSGPLLTRLAALCLGIDGQPSVCSALDLPAPIREIGSTGAVVLRELLARLASPAGSPRALLAVLEAAEPMMLPRERVDAVARVRMRVAGSVAGDEVGAVLVRDALSLVLAGFWTASGNHDCPERWLWSLDEQSVPSGYRRFVPALAAEAWRIWPGFELMNHPVAAGLHGWRQDTTGAYGVWFGATAVELPPRDFLNAPSGRVTAATPTSIEEPISVVYERGAQEGTRVLGTTLGRWIDTQTEATAHVDR